MIEGFGFGTPLFRELFLAFRKPPVIFKIVPEAAVNVSVHWRKSTTGENRLIWAKESQNRNVVPLSEQLLVLGSVFKEARRNCILIFSWTKNKAGTESKLIGLLQKYSAGDQIPLNGSLFHSRYDTDQYLPGNYLWNRYQSLGSRNCLLSPRKSPQPGPSSCRQLTNTCLESIMPSRGSQRDVVYLGWPIAPSYNVPKCGGGGGLSHWVQLCTWSPNKLWGSYSIGI